MSVTLTDTALFPYLALPRKGFVFLLGCGESGNLVIQNLLNQYSGIEIRGENDALFTRLIALWEAERNSRLQIFVEESPALNDEEVALLFEGLDHFGRLLADAFAGGVLAVSSSQELCGFREIRVLQPEVSIDRQIVFLKAFFPRAKFIVTTRDPKKIARSGWWADLNREEAVRNISEAQDQLSDAVRKIAGETAVLIDHDEYIVDPGALRPMYDLLDIPFDEASVASFLTKHGEIEMVEDLA